MSNHFGSNALNGVLHLLKEYNFLQNLVKDELVNFIEKVLSIGDDCDRADVLMGFAKDFNLCYLCLKFSDTLNKRELCKKCADPIYGT